MDRTPQIDLFAARARQPRVLTVSELTADLKALLEGRYASLHVTGEISNLRRPSSGHVYFTLKDAGACITAVMFRSQARLLKFSIEQGLSVVVRARLSVYEPQGAYQLVCDSVEPTGVGALMLAFEQLKARLAAEGLFDSSRKRPLPRVPRRIGVVTSTAGAALRDFLRTLHRRFPNLPVLIAGSRVQGDGAASEIARAVQLLGTQDVDVIVVTRGGGSLEDLWAFNEEVVARAIATSPVPVVSAVGHEVDFTIADFVADVRAATPTAAAELIAPVKSELAANLLAHQARLLRAWESTREARQARLDRFRARLSDPRRLLDARRLSLDRLEARLLQTLRAANGQRAQALERARQRLERAHPRARLLMFERAVATLQDRLIQATRRGLRTRVLSFHGSENRLNALSPLAVLSRGYALAFRDGHLVKTATDLAAGQSLDLRFSDGTAEVRVEKVKR